jgi:hypothetical protein
MIASSILAAVGAGLLYTLTPESDHNYWIGYQAIIGIGIGLGMQQPLIAVQTILDISEIPIGTSVVCFDLFYVARMDTNGALDDFRTNIRWSVVCLRRPECILQ